MKSNIHVIQASPDADTTVVKIAINSELLKPSARPKPAVINNKKLAKNQMFRDKVSNIRTALTHYCCLDPANTEYNREIL